MNSQDVAAYLENHPEFFSEHAELLASVTLPHPHGGRAISLTERQMMALREKNKALEKRLADLVRFGQENDAILDRLQRWTRGLLLQRNTRLLPDALTTSLAEIFSIPEVVLSVWEATDDFADLPCAAPVAVELISLANQLDRPYVGVPDERHAAVRALFREREVHSVALLPLRRGGASEAFGVLALGSADAKRFHGGMGTEILARLAETASAALTRLLS